MSIPGVSFMQIELITLLLVPQLLEQPQRPSSSYDE